MVQRAYLFFARAGQVDYVESFRIQPSVGFWIFYPNRIFSKLDPRFASSNDLPLSTEPDGTREIS